MKKILSTIKNQYEEICDKENPSNALDFIEEIIEELKNQYNI